ncbi:MAG: arylsulfatase [Dehalococcoidia bacterium]|nr:arylsulfatase [Dehalococcoidia bacterium]
MPLTEYPQGSSFPFTIGRTTEESSPAWPEPRRAPEDSPNVVFIVLDDTGYGQLGCYGSPIRTPNLDRLAQDGLRYRNMHTTALCSPTRSCILTGRNHHSNHVAGIMEISTGFPGYDCNIPFEHGFLSEILSQRGYNTYAVGKWHLTPAEQMSAAGPYDRWPTGRGFERYYGFLGGDTHQYYPALVHDMHQVDPPKTPEEGYHLTEDLVDRSIAFVADSKQVAPDKPFFLYLAPGAMHAPHHVPTEWADKYRGRFDAGWDAYREEVFARQKELGVLPADTELSPHDPDVPEWESLTDDERRVYARMMEVFAGFLEHTDHHLGRFIHFLEDIGQLDNTLLMVISDNGASAEGGPTGSVNENKFFNNVPESPEENLAALDDLGGPHYFNHYPWGWTWAGDTPFRRWKRETYRGGISDPFIVHWPDGIQARGELRDQFVHAIDMVPTVLDLLDIEPPAEIHGVTQAPIEGASFGSTLDDAAAPAPRPTQYFEMFGHRSIYHDGWRAVCPYPGPSFTEATGLGYAFGQDLTIERLRERDLDGWELYRVTDDPAEVHNLAGERPDVVQELISLWYVEAGKYQVLPIDGSTTSRLSTERPQLTEARTRYTYFPGTQTIPESSAVRVLNRPHVIAALVEIPDEGAEGILLSHGGASGGYALFVQDGKLHYVHNYVGSQQFHVESEQPIPSGRALLSYQFEVTGPPDLANGKGTPGTGTLFINEEPVGSMDLPCTMPNIIGIEGGLSCGRSSGSTVTPRYSAPFAFTGKIERVAVDVTGDRLTDHEAEVRMALARQ